MSRTSRLRWREKNVLDIPSYRTYVSGSGCQHNHCALRETLAPISFANTSRPPHPPPAPTPRPNRVPNTQGSSIYRLVTRKRTFQNALSPIPAMVCRGSIFREKFGYTLLMSKHDVWAWIGGLKSHGLGAGDQRLGRARGRARVERTGSGREWASQREREKSA